MPIGDPSAFLRSANWISIQQAIIPNFNRSEALRGPAPIPCTWRYQKPLWRTGCGVLQPLGEIPGTPCPICGNPVENVVDTCGGAE